MQVTLSDLNTIFSKAFDTETNITMDTVRDDIGEWTSINQLNLVVELEDFYHVSFSVDEIKDMYSVKTIVDILGKK